jgi:hypothetical protein
LFQDACGDGVDCTPHHKQELRYKLSLNVDGWQQPLDKQGLAQTSLDAGAARPVLLIDGVVSVYSVPSQRKIKPGGAGRRVLAAAALMAVFAFSTAAQPALSAERRKSKAAPQPQIQTPISPPTVLVSLRKQRLRVFDGTREITSSRISSGKPGFATPTGVFSVLEKKVYHESNIYDGAPMPFMQRVTWSGIAMHAGVVPGYPASHGCVRLPHAFSKTLFQLTSVGARVIITQDEASPVTFSHPALFKPLPENDPPVASTQGANPGETRVAANDATAADRAALTTLVGAAAAAAAPAHAIAADAAAQASLDDRPRSRTEAKRRFAEKLANLETTLRAAEEKKKAASEAAKAAVRTAQDAEARLNEVRRPFEQVLRAAAQAEAAREEASRAYRNFLNKTGIKEPPPRASTSSNKKRTARERERAREREQQEARDALSPEERELELEERLLDAVVDVKDTREGAKIAEVAIAEAKTAFEKADAERKAAIDAVQATIVDLRKAQTALIDGKAEAVRRARPLSIFISLKTQRLYIRQGFEPIFETPIDVDDPGTVGTHVFTAIDYDESGNDFRWQLVTAQSPRLAAAAAVEDEPKKKGKRKEPEGRSVGLNSAMAVEAATAALDSIRIPADVAEQIAELAKPGTSLIISEKALSTETGKGTEFVVLTR